MGGAHMLLLLLTWMAYKLLKQVPSVDRVWAWLGTKVNVRQVVGLLAPGVMLTTHKASKKVWKIEAMDGGKALYTNYMNRKKVGQKQKGPPAGKERTRKGCWTIPWRRSRTQSMSWDGSWRCFTTYEQVMLFHPRALNIWTCVLVALHAHVSA